MKRIFIVGVGLVVGCCGATSGSGGGGAGGAAQTTSSAGGVGGHGNTVPAGGAGGGALPACVCDCPNGPPEPPALDMFCADPANEGAVCCRKLDGSEVGTCAAHECAP